MIPLPDSRFIRAGQIIQRRRKALGYTQQSLAEQLDVSPTHMCRIERGCRPGLDMLLALAAVLGLSLDELFGLEPPVTDSLRALLRLVAYRPEADRRLALQLLQSFFQLRDQTADAGFLPAQGLSAILTSGLASGRFTPASGVSENTHFPSFPA